MRDERSILGTITPTGAAAVTPSTNVLDFGEIDDRSIFGKYHRTGEQHDSTVVFSSAVKLTAAVTGMRLQDSDDNTTFADVLTTADAAVGAGPGPIGWMKMPVKHRRYVRAAASSAQTTAVLTVWLEPGPGKD
jgi:hypothetical protein